MSHCPVPMPDGADCWRTPEPDGFAGICTEHMHAIAKAWVGDPVIRRTVCHECGMLALIRDRLSRMILCGECGHVIKLDPPEVDTRNLGTREPRPGFTHPARYPRTDVVYYIRFGDRIKIGTSTNLPKRLQSLPVDELLAIEPGAAGKERTRHREFAAHLVPGQIEWFSATQPLTAHAAALRAKYGPPMAAWRNWITRAAA